MAWNKWRPSKDISGLVFEFIGIPIVSIMTTFDDQLGSRSGHHSKQSIRVHQIEGAQGGVDLQKDRRQWDVYRRECMYKWNE